MIGVAASLLVLSLSFYSPVEGAINPSCVCVEFTGKSSQQPAGHFTSPDFPKPYDPGIGCVLYTFTASGGRDEIVEITIHSLNLPQTPVCGEGDYLSFYLHLEKGEVNERTLSNAKLCSLPQMPRSRERAPVRFYSALSTLVMAFHTVGSRDGDLSSTTTTTAVKTYSDDHLNQSIEPLTLPFPPGFNGTFRFVRRSHYRSDGQRIAGTVCDYQFISLSSHHEQQPQGLRKGKFYSPLYPSLYPTRSRCFYHFYGRYQERVKINFEKMVLGDEDVSCLTSEDGVRVYDGSDLQAPVISHLCGVSAHTELWSSSSALLIEFYSSNNISAKTYAGFEARFNFIPAASAVYEEEEEDEEEQEEVEEVDEDLEQEPRRGDGGSSTWSLLPTLVQTRTTATPTTTITTTSSTASPTTTTKKRTPVPARSTVTTTQRTIKTTLPAKGQTTAMRRIQTVPTRQPATIRTTTSAKPSTAAVTTTTLAPIVAVNTNSPIAVDVNFSPFFYDHNTSSPCDRIFHSDTGKNGTFTSPNYSSAYAPSMNCNYEFRGHGRERVQIVFTDFVLHHPSDDPNEKPTHPWLRQSCDGADRVTAFISVGGNKEKIDDFCGSGTPRELMSNSAQMSLHFHSTPVSKGARGFKARYSFVTNFGITTGEQILSTPCGFRFNSSQASNGTFWSPNFPGFYPRDTECHYFFYAQVGERVKIVFSYFDIEGMIPCGQTSASDYLEVSNFMTVDRKLPRYCGQMKDLKMESDGAFFRVTFKSNDRFDGTGFFANYQFTPVADAVTITRRRSSSAHSTHHGSVRWLPILLLCLAVRRVVL